jgi:CDGSH-type Zn-finger protein
MDQETPTIRIEAGGPYRVSGGVPLARAAPVRDEHGDVVAWAPLEPLATGRRFALCRCGRSATKPFCDDSHERAPWDGRERADRGLRAERAVTMVGDGVVLTDDRSICSHSAFCTDRLTTVWRMIEDTTDPAVRDRVRRMVALCPSGALERADAEGSRPVEPSFAPGVVAVRDGPLWVRGRVTVCAADGSTYEVRNRLTLCRCGHSANKPFCDGSHKEARFRDG